MKQVAKECQTQVAELKQELEHTNQYTDGIVKEHKHVLLEAARS